MPPFLCVLTALSMRLVKSCSSLRDLPVPSNPRLVFHNCLQALCVQALFDMVSTFSMRV